MLNLRKDKILLINYRGQFLSLLHFFFKCKDVVLLREGKDLTAWGQGTHEHHKNKKNRTKANQPNSKIKHTWLKGKCPKEKRLLGSSQEKPIHWEQQVHTLNQTSRLITWGGCKVASWTYMKHSQNNLNESQRITVPNTKDHQVH